MFVAVWYYCVLTHQATARTTTDTLRSIWAVNLGVVRRRHTQNSTLQKKWTLCSPNFFSVMSRGGILPAPALCCLLSPDTPVCATRNHVAAGCWLLEQHILRLSNHREGISVEKVTSAKSDFNLDKRKFSPAVADRTRYSTY